MRNGRDCDRQNSSGLTPLHHPYINRKIETDSDVSRTDLDMAFFRIEFPAGNHSLRDEINAGNRQFPAGNPANRPLLHRIGESEYLLSTLNVGNTVYMRKYETHHDTFTVEALSTVTKIGSKP